MDLAFDRIKLNLVVRREIPTETVRVFVEAVVAVTPEQAAEVPDLIRKTLEGVLPGEWSTSFATRKEDNAGMEQIVLQGSTRVPEAKTAGLADRLRRASRSGLSLKLRHIEFRPPQKQIDEVTKSLRAELYDLARAEADILNQRLPSDTQPWRVGNIAISKNVQRPERARSHHSDSYMSRHAHSGEEAAPEDESSLTVGVRIELLGDITLHRLSALPPGMFAAPQTH